MVKTLGHTLQVSESFNLGWGPKIYISGKFPDDGDPNGLVSTLWLRLIVSPF